ncbi:Piwi-like 2 [Pterocles gutturalis]|uniref:Piwi-like 2 n=1 Tax=Pterocles gutturalis TaxID=240206 RepID=A0A093BY39_9AVES|nr:Piwi-like 2 [Pterocles gutturalis]
MVLLVPELTFMTGLPESRDHRMVKDVMREMRQSPKQHYVRLTSLLRRIKENPEASQELLRWGLRLDPDIHRTQGRVLPAERINLRHSSFVPAEDLGWNKELMREASISVIAMNYWLLVYPKRLQDLAKDLLATIESICGSIGMHVSRPALVELKDERIETYARTIRSVLGTEDKVQLLLCIISNNREDLYGAIKKLCPVPSQVGPPRCVCVGCHWPRPCPRRQGRSRGRVLVAQGLGVGGLWLGRGMPDAHPPLFVSPASLPSGIPGWSSRCPTRRLPTACGSAWLMPCSISTSDFCSFLLPQMNHCLPKKIIVYRDGVSDGQLDTILKYEIPQMQKCFNTFENYQPSMVVVVVQKQISTNFYSLTAEQFSSPPPGTVIDHTVTSSEWQDFFLLAHRSRQGCSIPTRYVCVLNTANLSCEHLQRLTFKLCHLYWNWPGTVRVPAPCKYAHKLAFLAGQVLHHEPSTQLCNTLFFL